MTDAIQIAEALRGLSTGDQEPPRPWAHLSHVGITRVGPLGLLRRDGEEDAAGFEVFVGDEAYIVMVRRVPRAEA